MKEGFTQYLTSIGIGEPIANRVEKIYEFYDEILRSMGDEIQDIFITDYIQKDGIRQYENLWFFSDKFVMEAKLFISQDDFDFLYLKQRVSYLKVIKENYDFKEATELSRLNVEWHSGRSGGLLKASKENCSKLAEIVLKYLTPSIN
jgi:hypothetical protein